MGLFDIFKKQNTDKIFFNFPRNEEGINKVVEWIKQSEELILDLNESNNIIVMEMQDGHKYINVYTDLSQKQLMYQKNDKFAVTNYEGLAQMFEENAILDFILLNPKTDNVQLNRSVFTSSYEIKKNSVVQIGQPNNPPKELIECLINVAEQNENIKHVYFALMHNEGEFSYVVNIDSSNARDEVTKTFGQKIEQIYKNSDIPYPVDFIYNELIADEEYLIYPKSS